MEVKTGYKRTDAGVIPEEWSLRSLGTVCDVRDGTHESPRYLRQGVPFVTSKNIVDGRLDLENVSHICERDAEAFNKRSKVDRDDILMSMIGTIGSAVMVDFEPEFCIKNVALLKPQKIEPAFLVQLINSPLFQVYLGGSLDGGIQKFVALGTLRRLMVPVPPIPEQRAIAEALSDADALVESLEQLIAKKRQIKQGAMQDLLTGKKRLPGFSGEWEMTKFGEIAQPRRARTDPRRTEDRKSCIELEHIQQGTGCLVGCTLTGENSSLKSIFQKDDVLFGKLRAYLRKYWLADRGGLCSTEIWVLVANRCLRPRFLFQLVQMDRFIEVASSAYGTHMPRSDWSVVRNYEVRLPSVEEQDEIASVLSDMDAEIAALEAKLAKARQLKQGMMQELLTGRIRLV